MVITKLKVNNFRNLKFQTLDLSSGLNIFIGANAQGKTNLLEVVHLCSLGKSARTDKDKEMINWNSDNAYVNCGFSSRYGQGSVEVYLSKKEKKRIKINQVAITKIGELLGYIHCIYFSPDEIKVIKSSPNERRRLLDIDLCQLDKAYYYSLIRFNKILAQRNSLIKKGGELSLDIWNRQLAHEGAFIVSKRKEFSSMLAQKTLISHQHIAKGEKFEVEYSTAIKGNDMKQLEASYIALLEDSFSKDINLGYTSTGCQRDDLIFVINGTDIRNYGSQGQQRSAALSLKLAELEIFKEATKEYPVLLLDDVLSELDKTRQQQLLNYNNDVQIIMTTTHHDNLDVSKAKIFNITDGKAIAKP